MFVRKRRVTKIGAESITIKSFDNRLPNTFPACPNHSVDKAASSTSLSNLFLIAGNPAVGSAIMVPSPAGQARFASSKFMIRISTKDFPQ